MPDFGHLIHQQQLINVALFWGERILAAIIIFVVGRWIARRLVHIFERMAGRRVESTVADFLGNILYGLLIAVIAIAALQQLGVKTASLLAVLGAAGLAIGLAVQGSLSNFAAGIMLMVFRPFRVGEFVEVAGSMGTVCSVRPFHTLLTTLGGQELWIPNGSILSGQITNYSILPTRRVEIAVMCSYEDDLRKAREVLQNVIDADERVLKDPVPQILVVELGDRGVKLSVRLWTKAADWWATTCDMTENIKIAFDENGLTIPYPQRDVHISRVSDTNSELAQGKATTRAG